jgi:hypothetical protein
MPPASFCQEAAGSMRFHQKNPASTGLRITEHPLGETATAPDGGTFHSHIAAGMTGDSTIPVRHATALAYDQSVAFNSYHGACNGENGVGEEKNGYYDTEHLTIKFTSVAFGRLQPWGKQYDVTLRRIVKPIAMYATTMCDPRPVKIPELSKPYGFDLMKSDWVAPFGKGEKADFIFKLDSCDAKVPPGYYEMYPRAIRRKNETLTVAFSNPDDGIQGFISAPRQGSTFRSPRYAPESGYETNYVSLDRMDEGNQRNDKANENQNYIFRVRTMRDEHGAITNAFYGKIYGPFNYNAPFATCIYYLNPTSLDRNLEFDRTKNLLQGVVDQNQLPSEP